MSQERLRSKTLFVSEQCLCQQKQLSCHCVSVVGARSAAQSMFTQKEGVGGLLWSTRTPSFMTFTGAWFARK